MTGCLIASATISVAQVALLVRNEHRPAFEGISATTITRVTLLVVCVACVAYFQWLRGATKTARSLPGPVYLRTPRWMVLAYVIPILSLFRPYLDMLSLVVASDPTTLPEPIVRERVAENPGYRSSARRETAQPVARWARSVPVGRWWATWIALPCASLLVALAGDMRHPSLFSFALLRLTYVFGCFNTAVVVRGITSRLAERARRAALSASGDGK